MSESVGKRDSYPRKISMGDEILTRAWYSGYNFLSQAELDHLAVLKGKMLEHSIFYDDVDTASGVGILFNTTSSEPMILYEAEGSAEFLVQTYEDVVPVSTGVEVDKINLNRSSTFKGHTLVFSGASIYDVDASGTLLRTTYVAAHKFGGGNTQSSIWIKTKRNSYYYFKVTPDGDNTKVGIIFKWRACKV